MHVEIRKTKITRSIVDQCLHLSQKDLTDGVFNAIGWCVFTIGKVSYPYIILSDGNGSLRKLLKFSTVLDEGDRVVLPRRKFVETIFKADSQDEHEDLVKLSWKLFNQLQLTEQFFI